MSKTYVQKKSWISFFILASHLTLTNATKSKRKICSKIQNKNNIWSYLYIDVTHFWDVEIKKGEENVAYICTKFKITFYDHITEEKSGSKKKEEKKNLYVPFPLPSFISRLFICIQFSYIIYNDDRKLHCSNFKH